MIRPRQRKLGIAAVAAVALAAAGAAVAASRTHGPTSSALDRAGSPTLVDYGTRPGHPGRGGDELRAAAAYLGISESVLGTDLASGKTLAQIADATSGKSAGGLIDALVAAERAELAQAVTDGRLTQAQADQIATTIVDRMTAVANGKLPPRGPGIGHGPGDDLQAAADYLGLSVTDLMTQLRSGKTLAQVAAATSGKSAAGLVDALVKHEETELAQAVKDGKLTQAQADQIGTNLKARITARVNGTGDDHDGFGRRGFGPGPRDDDRGGTPPATHI